MSGGQDFHGRVERSSELALDAASVWARAVTLEGVNAEFGRLLRMTAPRALRGATIDDLTIGEPAGRSWLLLFGFIPIEFDDLCLAELDPGRRFLERSQMGAFTLWQHERIIEPAPAGGCTVTDRLAFRLRRPLGWIPGAARLSTVIVAALFSHRHRRLRRLPG